jgi:hypothetical protein
MKQSKFELEKILWSVGAVMIISAIILALTEHWSGMTLKQKYTLIVWPMSVVYVAALVLSFKNCYPYLRVCLYLIVGLIGPVALSIVLARHGLPIALASLLMMLIPAVWKPQKTVQVFCLCYVIWAYFTVWPFFPEPGQMLPSMLEKVALGLALWALPWVLPQSWRSVAESWGRPLGALALLFAVTSGLFLADYPAWFDWVDLPVGLLVLVMGIWARSRLIMIELVFFYVVNVLELSAKYFNHFSSWPLVLLMIGAGLIVFGMVYLKIRRYVVS